MKKSFVTEGGIVLPENVNLSGHLWVKCAMEVYEGGHMERDPERGLINVGGKKKAEFEGPAQSFLRSWTQFFRNLFYTPSNIPDEYTDDGGVNRLTPIYQNGAGGGQGFDADLADFAFGDNNGAVLSSQFNLLGTILGPTPGVVATVLQEDNVARVFKVESTVLNGGANITIQEVGLFGHWRQQDLAVQNRRTMLMRDIINPGVLVQNGQTALGRYTFTAAI